MRPRTIFITGTDTGVGKTVLTALLVAHLRNEGCQARAIKPFCSGGREDAELLRIIQDRDLTLDEVNPFYFREPLAPLVAARLHRQRIKLPDVLKFVHSSRPILNPQSSILSRPPCLLIEGSGGIMVPLGDGYFVADLVEKLNCEVIVVAKNGLGTINHTLLTIKIVSERTKKRIKVVLMDEKAPDLSSRSNRRILAETLAPMQVWTLPFLDPSASHPRGLKKSAKKMKIMLASILG